MIDRVQNNDRAVGSHGQIFLDSLTAVLGQAAGKHTTIQSFKIEVEKMLKM